MIIAVAGFLLLIVALPSYFSYQYQYNYAKARLDNPNDNHLTYCDGGGYGAPMPCKVELPELSQLTILGVGIGVSLMIIGATISLISYARYEPKPKPNNQPSASYGAPFKL